MQLRSHDWGQITKNIAQENCSRAAKLAFSLGNLASVLLKWHIKPISEKFTVNSTWQRSSNPFSPRKSVCCVVVRLFLFLDFPLHFSQLEDKQRWEKALRSWRRREKIKEIRPPVTWKHFSKSDLLNYSANQTLFLVPACCLEISMAGCIHKSHESIKYSQNCQSQF